MCHDDVKTGMTDLNNMGTMATRNSALTELRKSDEMKPQFVSPSNLVNGSQSLVEYQKQLGTGTPAKASGSAKKSSVDGHSAVKTRALSGSNIGFAGMLSPPKSSKKSCKKKRVSHLSSQPGMQQIFSPQAKKLFKKSPIKGSSKSITDGMIASVSINQSQILSVHP